MNRTNYYRVFWTSHRYSNYNTRLEAVGFLAKKLPVLLQSIRIEFDGQTVSESERRRIIIDALESLN
jgi:hypothetical protein